jgi:hypothetical protein
MLLQPQLSSTTPHLRIIIILEAVATAEDGLLGWVSQRAQSSSQQRC